MRAVGVLCLVLLVAVVVVGFATLRGSSTSTVGLGVSTPPTITPTRSPSSSAASSPATAANARASSAASSPAAATTKKNGVIVSEKGTTWGLRVNHGQRVSVRITPHTAFGSKTAPQKQSQFPVGTKVSISGTDDKGQLIAKRITARASSQSTSSPSPTS